MKINEMKIRPNCKQLHRSVTKGDTIPQVLYYYGGYRMTAGRRKAPKMSQVPPSTKLTFASERLQVRTWGRQVCFLSRAPFNLDTHPCSCTLRPI